MQKQFKADRSTLPAMCLMPSVAFHDHQQPTVPILKRLIQLAKEARLYLENHPSDSIKVSFCSLFDTHRRRMWETISSTWMDGWSSSGSSNSSSSFDQVRICTMWLSCSIHFNAHERIKRSIIWQPRWPTQQGSYRLATPRMGMILRWIARRNCYPSSIMIHRNCLSMNYE